MRLAILLVGAALGAYAQLCSVEGKVLNDATGQPVSKATVMLRGSATFNTRTDDKGRYAFAGIEAGSYTLTAQRAGFVPATYGAIRPGEPGKNLVLTPSGKVAGADLRVIPGGAISGKVLLADGDPATGASLTLLRAKYVDGRKQLVEMSPSTMVQDRNLMAPANDLGEFHIAGLEPGRYYLRADAGNQGVRFAVLNARVAGQVMDPVRTYYPSGADTRSAQPIEVRSGRTISDITMILGEMPIGTVRGRLESSAALSGKSVNVVLFGDSGQLNLRMDPQTGELDGQGALPPGRYIAVVIIGTGPAPGAGGPNPGAAGRRFDLIPVDVNAGPLTIVLHPAVALAGVVRADEAGARIDLRQIHIVLRPAAYLPAMPEMLLPVQPLAADGRFAFPEVAADRYAVQLFGLPEGFYVQSIRAGDSDALEKDLDLTAAGSGKLEIVLSRKAGSVVGLVTDAQGKPSEGATVALVPVKGREYRTAITTADGRFSVKAAPPGEYRAFAWQDVEEGAWTAPEFLKPLLAKSTLVTVQEGSAAKLELQSIPVP